MVVADLDVMRIAVDKPEADAPLSVHRDRVLPLSVVLERMQAIARWHLQVIQAGRQVDVFQLADGTPGDVGRKALGCPRREQVPGLPVRERLDHWLTVACHVTRVNRLAGSLACSRLGLFA